MTFNPVAQGIVQIFESVIEERDRAMRKWGIQNHPDGTHDSPHNRDVRDEQRNVVDQQAENGESNWYDILLEEVKEAGAEVDLVALDKELCQVMQVCTVWREDIQRRQTAVSVTEGLSDAREAREARDAAETEVKMRKLAEGFDVGALVSLANGNRPGRNWLLDDIRAAVFREKSMARTDDLHLLAQWVRGLPSSWWDENFRQDALGHPLPNFSRSRPVEDAELP